MTRAGAQATAPSPGVAIQRNDPLPYYAQLADILREEIHGGRWQPGELLPSEAELGEFFDLSRTVVRQALGQLQDEGLVQKERGRGTFVTRRKVASFVVQELRGFHDDMTKQGKRVETNVLCQGVIEVPPEVAPNLEVPMGSEVVAVERVRIVDGDPVVEVHTYLPAPRFAGLVDVDLENLSLYTVLEERYGIHPHGGVRSIEAEGASRTVARNLGVRAGSPVLRLDAINLDADRTPFEFFRAWYRGDLTTFQIWLDAKAEEASWAARSRGPQTWGAARWSTGSGSRSTRRG